jgi:Protein of unknown function (DUF3194)
VEELGLPELTSEQIEELCTTVEDAAKKYIFSKVSPKMVERFNISVEAEGEKPLRLIVDVDIALAPSLKEYAIDQLVKDATKEALKASDDYLRKLK